MKLRPLLAVLSISSLSLVGCEEAAEPPAAPAEEAPAQPSEPAAEPEAQPEAAATPTQVCTQLAEAAKAKDEAKIGEALSGGIEGLDSEAVKTAFVTNWASASCGEAKVEGDKATVPVTFGQAKEPTPTAFVKADDAWKLDTAAYLAQHPLDKAKTKKGKKGKKGKKQKKG